MCGRAIRRERVEQRQTRLAIDLGVVRTNVAPLLNGLELGWQVTAGARATCLEIEDKLGR